jgi:anti-sigma factor RsiW
VTREEARARLSDYLEGGLDPAARDEMQAFLAREPDAAAELIGLERTLALLHRLPPREPTLDLWREFAPQVEAFRAERRLGLAERLRGQWGLVVAGLSEGVILWTHALAERAHRRLGRHLRHDTLRERAD